MNEQLASPYGSVFWAHHFFNQLLCNSSDMLEAIGPKVNAAVPACYHYQSIRHAHPFKQIQQFISCACCQVSIVLKAFAQKD